MVQEVQREIVKRLFESRNDNKGALSMDSMTSIQNKLKKSAQISVEDLDYCTYLKNHIEGVQEFFYSILMPILLRENISKDTIYEISDLINNHDKSKLDSEEFAAYRNYFFDKKKFPRDSEEFSRAWNAHQKNNPHHWQYWCLIQDIDEPKIRPLDMPFKYIIELLCDWASAGKYYGNTAREWYNKIKDRMMITDYTRSIIEKYIDYLV